MNNPQKFSPIAVLTFGILSASTAAIFVRYAQEYASSIVIAAYRLGIASAILLPFVLFLQRKELMQIRGKNLIILFFSGFFLSIHFAAWITSLEFTTVASSVVLVTTTPLWVALLSPITVKEKLTSTMKWGMMVALVGGILVGVSDTCVWTGNQLTCPSFHEVLRGEAFLGDLLALLGAFMAACYIIVGRSMRERTSLLSYVFIVYGFAAMVLIVLAIFSRQQLSGFPKEAYVWFFLLALIPQLLGHSSFNWALRFLSASYVSIALLGEPIGSTIFAYIFLDEQSTLLKIIGGAIILTGIFIASRSGKA